jgi:hypothetical protein
MNEFLTDLEGILNIDPPELGQEFFAVLSLEGTKYFATRFHGCWTPAQEAALQECTAALIAAAHVRGLQAFQVTATRTDGQMQCRELDLAMINKARCLH